MTADNDPSTDHRRGPSPRCGSGAEAVAVEQLAGKCFIRLREASKRPISGDGPEKGPHFRRDDPQLVGHVESGGNVARVANDDLVVLDVDSAVVADHLDHLPETLEIGTEKGRHLWFKCREGIGSRVSITTGDQDLGSIRTGHDYALVPPSVHPSGSDYRIVENREVANVSRASLLGVEPAVRQTLETADSTAQHRDRRATEAAAAPSAARRSGSGAVADALSMVDHDERRADLVDVLVRSDPHHGRRQWFAGFLYAVVGLSEREIVDLIMSHARWDDLDRQTTRRQVHAVAESAESGRGEWSP